MAVSDAKEIWLEPRCDEEAGTCAGLERCNWKGIPPRECEQLFPCGTKCGKPGTRYVHEDHLTEAEAREKRLVDVLRELANPRPWPMYDAYRVKDLREKANALVAAHDERKGGGDG